MIDRVDTAWFYCFDDKQWYDPTGVAEQIAFAEPIRERNGAPAPDSFEQPQDAVDRAIDNAIEVEEQLAVRRQVESAKLRRLR